MERATTMAGHSRVNSSTMFNNFKVRLSAEVSNWKSSAQSAFGAIGHIAPTSTPSPRRGFFRLRYGTRSPSSRQRRWIRLLFTRQPSRRAALAARRHPQRGRSRENARRNSRSVSSSGGAAGGQSRWVDRCWPTTRHARRCETPNRACNMTVAARRRFGVRSFPPPTP